MVKVFMFKKSKFFNYITFQRNSKFIQNKKSFFFYMQTFLLLKTFFVQNKKSFFFTENASNFFFLRFFVRTTFNYCLTGLWPAGFLSNHLFKYVGQKDVFFDLQNDYQCFLTELPVNYVLLDTAVFGSFMTEWLNTRGLLFGGAVSVFNKFDYNYVIYEKNLLIFWFYYFLYIRFNLFSYVSLKVFYSEKKFNKNIFVNPYLIWFRKKRTLLFFRKFIIKKKNLLYNIFWQRIFLIFTKRLFFKKIYIYRRNIFFKKESTKRSLAPLWKKFIKRKYDTLFSLPNKKVSLTKTKNTFFYYRSFFSKRVGKISRTYETMMKKSSQKKEQPRFKSSLAQISVKFTPYSIISKTDKPKKIIPL